MQVHRHTVAARLLALLAVAVLSAACYNFKDIEITSCELASLEPKGFRAVDAVLQVGVNNPTVSITLSDVTGAIRNGDLVVATFGGGPVTIDRKSEKVYELPCTVKLEEGLSLFQVLTLIKTMDFDGYVCDVTGTVALKNGLKKKLEFKDIPINSLMDKESARDLFKL